MKAYKSYKYLLAGWVGEVSVNCIANSGGIVVVRAKVRHSQSVRASPLLPWIAAKKDGTVLCSHCTCMAGLGEACSHIAATLFTVDAHSRFSKDDACTSQLCAWLPPSMQNVEYASISDIDFTAPATKRKRNSESQADHLISSNQSVPAPSIEELSIFYKSLSKSGKPAILSLRSEYSDSYILDHS